MCRRVFFIPALGSTGYGPAGALCGTRERVLPVDLRLRGALPKCDFVWPDRGLLRFRPPCRLREGSRRRRRCVPPGHIGGTILEPGHAHRRRGGTRAAGRSDSARLPPVDQTAAEIGSRAFFAQGYSTLSAINGVVHGFPDPKPVWVTEYNLYPQVTASTHRSRPVEVPRSTPTHTPCLSPSRNCCCKESQEWHLSIIGRRLGTRQQERTPAGPPTRF